MTVETIQNKINKKQEELKVLEKELKDLKNKEEANKRTWLYIKELDIEVEVEVHDKGKSYDDLNLKDREDELLTVEQCIFLANSKYAKELKMDGSSSNDDFFIKQPFNINREKGYVAVFCSGRVGSYFDCCRDSRSSDVYRGVRFCRKKISRDKN